MVYVSGTSRVALQRQKLCGKNSKPRKQFTRSIETNPAPSPIISLEKREEGKSMALFSMKLENLKDLFVTELQDLYDAENQITKALPKMIGKAENPRLKSALQEHLQVTEGQIQRLERIFNTLNQKPSGQTCKGMKGVIAEGDEMIGRSGDPSVIDAGIISAAQRVEHYEMAGYGTVRTYADLLGMSEAASLLQKTLDEEKEADLSLSQIAKTINVEARAA